MKSIHKKSNVVLTALMLGLSLSAFGSNARWIVAPEVAAAKSSVSNYRLTVPIDRVPERYMVRVTADALYHLYVNGVRAASGPTSGDPQKWRVDTVDLAPNLVSGPNTLAIVVWSPLGKKEAPICFMGKSAGLFLEGVSDPSISTGTGDWKAYANMAYSALPKPKVRGYYALGSFENFNANLHPWGWAAPTFNDTAWTKPIVTDIKHQLVPREIPMMEFRRDRLVSVRESKGVQADDAFLAGEKPITIPAKTTATLLFDRGELSNAFPELLLSGGRDASIEMGYAESLYTAGRGNRKGDRNIVKGKQWSGSFDQIIADGGEKRLYRPLWHRTFRYMRLNITTADKPLTLLDLTCEFVGYPFKEVAQFDANNEELQRIWDVGWHTLRLCAVDNFYDCPYYERLQYVGDTRIEALVSVYVSGDDRLMRKAISLFNDSLGKEGLTASRYPSHARQVIPPFSNWWIAMVDDYRQLNGDKAFIESTVPAIKSIINRFKKRTEDASGLVTFSGKGEWDFVDWSAHLAHAKERRGKGSQPSGLLSLNHVYALDRAVKIMRYVGDESAAREYEALSANLRKAVLAHCWDAKKGILSDDPRMERYTEHANLLGILTDSIPLEKQRAVMQRILDKKVEMAPATIYFRFYYNRALVKTGLANEYLNTLAPWRNQLKLNLSTWAEKPEPSRSDCHAWGSSPNYEFLATVAGIMPASAGFATVRIAPALGGLKLVDARMPHPKGMIEVELQKTGKGLAAQISLPDQVTGTFEWGGKKIPMKPGKQTLSID